jgi:phosphatidate cytidylyltransferase
MKEIWNRTFTGIIYVSILISSLFIDQYIFYTLVSIACYIVIYEFQKFQESLQLRLFTLFPIFLYFGVVSPPHEVFVWILVISALLTNLLLGIELITKKELSFPNFMVFVISAFYIVGSLNVLAALPSILGAYEPKIVLGFLLIVWTSDSFAYFVGKGLGKTPLFKSVSPKKTIEGFVGGLIASLVIGWFLYDFLAVFSQIEWMLIALVTCVTGTLGDLVQSKYKRAAGVKDSGTWMPGHGGLFDRMDSIIFAAPFVFFTIKIIKYVS